MSTPNLPLPSAVPMDLPRQIMRRALAVALVGVCLMAGLGLMRMRDNVGEELEAARVLALLAERLTTLQAVDDSQAVLALQRWRAEGELRHLALRLVDAQGRDLLGPPPQPSPAAGEDADEAPSAWMRRLSDATAALLPPPAPFTVAWSVARPQGPAWTVSLSADADSEQLEALQFLLESVLTVALVSAGMLLVMTWNTRLAFRPLSELLAAIAQLRAGRREPLAALPPMAVGEMQAIADALRELAQALALAEQERQWLGQKVLTLQEDERQRLARELHDEFGQRLTALRVDAAWLARQVAGQPALASVVAGMSAHCEMIQRDIRAVLTRLQPLGPLAPSAQAADGDAAPASDELQRLVGLLQELVAGWQPGRAEPGATGSHPRSASVTLALSAVDAAGRPAPWPPQPMPRLPLELMLAIYRISQEALTNVARHAQAGRAVLSLCWRAPQQPGELPQVDWSVVDDGQGVADLGNALRRGNGLAGIKERIWARGADLEAGLVEPGAARPGWRLATRFNVPQTADERWETEA